jgi:hypothetical protein
MGKSSGFYISSVIGMFRGFFFGIITVLTRGVYQAVIIGMIRCSM